jgi:hypothetical protein
MPDLEEHSNVEEKQKKRLLRSIGPIRRSRSKQAALRLALVDGECFSLFPPSRLLSAHSKFFFLFFFSFSLSKKKKKNETDEADLDMLKEQLLDMMQQIQQRDERIVELLEENKKKEAAIEELTAKVIEVKNGLEILSERKNFQIRELRNQLREILENSREQDLKYKQTIAGLKKDLESTQRLNFEMLEIMKIDSAHPLSPSFLLHTSSQPPSSPPPPNSPPHSFKRARSASGSLDQLDDLTSDSPSQYFQTFQPPPSAASDSPSPSSTAPFTAPLKPLSPATHHPPPLPPPPSASLSPPSSAPTTSSVPPVPTTATSSDALTELSQQISLLQQKLDQAESAISAQQNLFNQQLKESNDAMQSLKQE